MCESGIAADLARPCDTRLSPGLIRCNLARAASQGWSACAESPPAIAKIPYHAYPTMRETQMSRYREISPAEMTPAQKQVHDEIVAGKRGRFGGPFQLLIRAPEVCRHLSRLGEYLRWGSSLPPALSELAICLTARSIRANYEWHAHAPLAIEAGAPAAAMEAIRTGASPKFAAADQ